MEVKFTDTFFDSLKRLIRRERLYWKTWNCLRYDLPRFFKNLWIFRKVLWKHRWWGWRYTMEIMYTSISVMEKGMHNGLEVRKTRDKKIEKMQRAMYLMKCFIDDNFIELAEKELGEIVHKEWKFKECDDNPNLYEIVDDETPEEKEHRDKVYDRAREIEEKMWYELWEIFKGQDYSKFKQAPEDFDLNKKYEYWIEQFDGSGMRGWWD